LLLASASQGNALSDGKEVILCITVSDKAPGYRLALIHANCVD
jgi:hypothetical protein